MYNIILTIAALIIAFIILIWEMQRDWPVLPIRHETREYWKEFQKGNKWFFHFMVSRIALIAFLVSCVTIIRLFS